MGFTEEIHRGNLDQMCLNIINKYPFLTVYSWITELLGRDGVDVGNTSVVPEQKSLSLSLCPLSLPLSFSLPRPLSRPLSLTSFNFMAALTICSDFEAPKNKV